MRWLRVSKGLVELSDSATVLVVAEMGAVFGGLERGGTLLGRRLRPSPDIIVDLVQGPLDEDSSSRLSFRRSRAHQAVVDSIWSASGGTVNYLGDWHTHPELRPCPSRLDHNTWLSLAREQRLEHQPLFFLIVGAQEVGCWEVSSQSCVRLLPCGRHFAG